MSNYNNEKVETELLIAKVEDKYKFCISKNKIQFTDFMQLTEKSIVQKYLDTKNIKNCFWYGGLDNSDREILIFYPEKLDKDMVMKNIDDILSVVHIDLPNEENLEHGQFLSGIMKLGIVREKFGDIIVRENGADIIAFNNTAEFFVNNLPLLTRFRKAKINIKSIIDLEDKDDSFEEISIIVTSIRLDNFVAELARCSRNGAQEFLKEQRVFVNGICEMKDSKKLNIGDIITIRGKGKFVFESITGNTKSDRIKVSIRKYK